MASIYKSLLVTILSLFLLIFIPQHIAFAANTSLPAITVINPIRGTQLGHEKDDLLASLQSQWKANQDAQIHATWLWQYSALENEKLTSFAKNNMATDQEFGLFFEIDRNFTQKADVLYRGKGPWYFSDGLLLDSYDQGERRKLIDTAFAKFKQTFGYYPKTVGAWWIGADSLMYMQQKYGIIASLKASEQYNLDVYSIWGTPWSIPYIPSKQNAGIPASTRQDSSHIVMMQWAARDPLRGYGDSFDAATYSIQDYFIKGYDFSYFDYLSRLYLQKPGDQIVIGLENGNAPKSYQAYYRDLLLHAHQMAEERKINIVLARDYAQSFLNKHETFSPTHYFLTKDFKTNDQAFWYNGENYRVSVQKRGDNIYLVDLRDYSNKVLEDFAILPNSQGYLRINTPAIIDSVRIPQQKRLLATSKEPLHIINIAGNITLFSGNEKIAYVTASALEIFTYHPDRNEGISTTAFINHQTPRYLSSYVQGSLDYTGSNSVSLRTASVGKKIVSQVFNFGIQKPYINIFIILLIIDFCYFVILYLHKRDIKTTIIHGLFLLTPLLIAYPLLSAGQIDRLNFFFDKKEFILFPLLGIPIFPLSLRILLIFQIIPFLFLLPVHYVLIIYKTNKAYTVLFFCFLTLITILYLHLPYFPLDKSTYVRIFTVIGLITLISTGVLLFVFLRTKSRKALYWSIVSIPISFVILLGIVIISRSTFIITPFEMEALQFVANRHKDVGYINPTTQPIYKAVRPLLLDNYQVAAQLTGTQWDGLSKTDTIVVPRYLGADLPDEVKKYNLVKIFDNAQIAIYASSRSISYNATIKRDSLHPSGVFSLYSGE